MKYYVVADVHGFYDIMVKALTEKGYYADKAPHKIIMCGDLFDRGPQNKEMEQFVLERLKRDEIILIRGNHEDLLVSLVERLPTMDEGEIRFSSHYSNGTVDTVRQITGATMSKVLNDRESIAEQMKQSGVFTEILPAMRDYYETEKYIFVHGWIPSDVQGFGGRGLFFNYKPDWRKAGIIDWAYARWYNGMLAAHQGNIEPGKTIVCGHWNASFGHTHYEGSEKEFGKGADHSEFYADGIIAIDACTFESRRVNCIVIEDNELTASG